MPSLRECHPRAVSWGPPTLRGRGALAGILHVSKREHLQSLMALGLRAGRPAPVSSQRQVSAGLGEAGSTHEFAQTGSRGPCRMAWRCPRPVIGRRRGGLGDVENPTEQYSEPMPCRHEEGRPSTQDDRKFGEIYVLVLLEDFAGSVFGASIRAICFSLT